MTKVKGRWSYIDIGAMTHDMTWYVLLIIYSPGTIVSIKACDMWILIHSPYSRFNAKDVLILFAKLQKWS